MARGGLSAGDWDDVDVVEGDVAAPGFGLNPEDAERLEGSVDLILHNAADTSFIPKQSVRDTNIRGAENLVAFARRCKRKPLIVYMSTASNAGKAADCVLNEEEGCKPDNDHHNPYTHSKAVGERVLQDSGLPVLVLRPTIVLSAGLEDEGFARNILWFVPLSRRFDALPINPDSRLDVVTVSFVVDATLALLQQPALRFGCYNLSAGERGSRTAAEWSDFIDRCYRRRSPLRLVRRADWTKELHRTFVRSPLQRKIFFGLRYYLPFLNMNVVYDDSRLRSECGASLPELEPFESYLGDLLGLIKHKSAVGEIARP
jgi:thioester reductase-like protein